MQASSCGDACKYMYEGSHLTLKQLHCICSIGWGVTFLISKLLAKLLDQLIDLGMNHYLILITNAVFTQEVKLDVIIRQALHILNLPHSRNAVTNNCCMWFTAVS